MKILQGIDLLKTERIQKVYLKFGDKFLSRIFSLKEIEQIKDKNKYKYTNKIASKFSAKEATSKAIGTGFSEGVKFKDIEILNKENGKPFLKLHGNASQKIDEILSSSVSISDEDDLVISIVTFIVKD
tara:strand:- start:116 stop:499 length:384 start_codon:yes stop_codon:yes gene_type:complete